MTQSQPGRSHDPLMVGLDMGSTSVKAVIYEPSGKTAAKSCLPALIHYPRPGWAYYDPAEVWAQAVEALRDAAAQLDDPSRIAGIAVTSVGEAGVPLDEHGEPTHEFIAWFDQRALKQEAWAKEAFGDDRLYEITGLALAPIYSLFKLLWIKENAPEAWAKAKRWLMVADYMAFKLSGEQATDWSLACRTSAFDIRKLDWSDEVSNAAGIPRDLFAPAAPSGTAIGKVTPEAARETGLPEGAIVATGGHDHICGALAAGIVRPGAVLDSFGTAEVVLLSLEQPIDDPNLGRQHYCQGPHVARGLYYVYGGLFTAGACINWWKDVVGDDHVALISEASGIPAGSFGVGFLPHLRMASSPNIDPRSRGAFVGLTSDVTRPAMTRALFEGLSMEARNSLEPLLKLASNGRVGDVTLIGGGTRNELLAQIKASVYNSTVRVLNVEEETAHGAAILAGIGAGVYRDAEDALNTIRSESTFIEPIDADVQVYEEYYRQAFQPLYAALRDVNHAIHQMTREEGHAGTQAGA